MSTLGFRRIRLGFTLRVCFVLGLFQVGVECLGGHHSVCGGLLEGGKMEHRSTLQLASRHTGTNHDVKTALLHTGPVKVRTAVRHNCLAIKNGQFNGGFSCRLSSCIESSEKIESFSGYLHDLLRDLQASPDAQFQVPEMNDLRVQVGNNKRKKKERKRTKAGKVALFHCFLLKGSKTQESRLSAYHTTQVERSG